MPAIPTHQMAAIKGPVRWVHPTCPEIECVIFGRASSIDGDDLTSHPSVCVSPSFPTLQSDVDSEHADMEMEVGQVEGSEQEQYLTGSGVAHGLHSPPAPSAGTEGGERGEWNELPVSTSARRRSGNAGSGGGLSTSLSSLVSGFRRAAETTRQRRVGGGWKGEGGERVVLYYVLCCGGGVEVLSGLRAKFTVYDVF